MLSSSTYRARPLAHHTLPLLLLHNLLLLSERQRIWYPQQQYTCRNHPQALAAVVDCRAGQRVERRRRGGDVCARPGRDDVAEGEDAVGKGFGGVR